MPKRLAARRLSNPVAAVETSSSSTENTSWTVSGYEKTTSGTDQIKLYNPNEFLTSQTLETTPQHQPNHVQPDYSNWNQPIVTSAAPSLSGPPVSSIDLSWNWSHEIQNGQHDPWNWNTSSSSSPATGSNTHLEWNNNEYNTVHRSIGHTMWNSVENQVNTSIPQQVSNDFLKNNQLPVNTSVITHHQEQEQQHLLQQTMPETFQHQQGWDYNSYANQQQQSSGVDVHQTAWQPVTSPYQWTNHGVHSDLTVTATESENKLDYRDGVANSERNLPSSYIPSVQTSSSDSSLSHIPEGTVTNLQNNITDSINIVTSISSEDKTGHVTSQCDSVKANPDMLQVQSCFSTSHPHLFQRTDSWLSGSSLQTFHNSLSGSQDLLDASYFMPQEAVDAVRQHMASLSLKPDDNDTDEDVNQSAQPAQSTDVSDNLKNEEIPFEQPETDASNSLPNQISDIAESEITDGVEQSLQQLNSVPDDNEGVIEGSLQSEAACNNEGIRQPPDGAAAIRPLNVATGRASAPATAIVTTTLPQVTNVLPNPGIGETKINEKSLDKGSVSDNENVENLKAHLKNVSSATGKSDAFPHHLNVYNGLIGPREGSPFKPPVKSAATIPSIIQHELPDNHSLTLVNDTTDPDNGANLEMTPDNVERPNDLEHNSTETQKEIKETALSSHESFSRNLRDLNNDSPSATLWQNPEPRQGNIFLLPAASNPPVNQNILIVPSLSDQQEILDNPLGKNTHPENSNSENIENISSSEIKNNVNDEQCIKEKLYDNVGTSASQNNMKSTPSIPVSSSIIQNEHVFIPDKDKLRLLQDSKPQESSLEENNVNNSVNRNMQSFPSNKNQTESVAVGSDDFLPTGHNRGQRPPVPGLGPVQPPRALSEPPGSQQFGSQPSSNYDERESEFLSQKRQDGYTYSQKEMEERHDNRNHNTDYSRERYRTPDMYSDMRHAPRNVDDPYGRDPRDRRKDYGRDRYYERDDAYRYKDDRYYSAERERSRPSSRGSVDYDYDRHYQGNRSRENPYADEHLRTTGYDSDRENYYRNYNYQNYDQYRGDPRYYKDYNYSQYDRDRYYQRYYADQYYGYNNYNYGYYDELYRNDPVFRAQYDAQYRDYYARQGYDSSDRRTVQSGRSSVNDDIQRERKTSQGFVQNSPHVASSVNSSYEQAMYSDYMHKESFSQQYEPSATNARLTPVKFRTPHVKIQFTSTGQLVKVLPNNPSEGQPARVEIHQLQALLSDHQEIEELKVFPGPLQRNVTHKNDVIQYCCDKIKQAKDDASLHDRDSYILIWDLLILLIRQNGSVVGTDIAELLLRDHASLAEESLSSENATSSDNLTQDEVAVSDTSFAAAGDCSSITKSDEDKVTQKFREYLLFGHKKEALEKAMKNGLWGHALFLASKMDARTHANVMTRFANSLRLNDPLQTLYQLMSGRQPAAVTCIAEEKWGDWRPHLAMILSNTSNRPELDRKSITTLGDTLATRGCLHAAHFCYLMAQMEFGTYSSKSSKLVLLGSNHSLPFSEFVTTEAIQCTEIYEYALSLANPEFILPHFQSYRFIYATRLAEYGLSQEALHYCEIISSHINRRPAFFHPDMVIQVYELANKLKYFDPCFTNAEGELNEVDDPQWLQQLRNNIHAYNSGTIEPDFGSVNSTFIEENSSKDSGLYTQQQLSAPSEGFYNAADTSHTEPLYSNEQLDQSSVVHQNNYTHYGSQMLSDTQNLHSLNQTECQQAQHLESSSSYNDLSYDPQSNYSYTHTQPVNSNFMPHQDNSSNYDTNHSHDAFSQNQIPPAQDYWALSTRKDIHSTNAAPTSEFKNTSTLVNRRASSSSNRSNTDKHEEKKETKTKQSTGSNSGWLGGIFNKFMPKPKNQMKLPDDRNPTIIWDSTLNRWVNTEEDEEETSTLASHPPMDSEILKGISQANKENVTPPVGSGEFNKFRRSTNKGPKQHYVDVVSKGMTTASNVVPQNLLPNLDSPLLNTSQLLIPTSVPGNEPEMTYFPNSVGSPQISTANSRVNSPLHKKENETNEATVPAAPVMFNPMQMSLPASNQPRTSRLGRNRYPQ